MKQIAINIPDYLYERICKVINTDAENYYMSQLDRADMYEAIRNGIVLDNLSNGELITSIIDPDSEDCVGIECQDGVVTFQVTQDVWDRKQRNK